MKVYIWKNQSMDDEDAQPGNSEGNKTESQSEEGAMTFDSMTVTTNMEEHDVMVPKEVELGQIEGNNTGVDPDGDEDLLDSESQGQNPPAAVVCCSNKRHTRWIRGQTLRAIPRVDYGCDARWVWMDVEYPRWYEELYDESDVSIYKGKKRGKKSLKHRWKSAMTMTIIVFQPIIV